MKLRNSLKINNDGKLQIGEFLASDLANKYATPLYVLDEEHIRNVCRSYKKILTQKYPDSLVCYASKAFSAVAMYNIINSEGLGADVVTGGELYTAIKGGISPKKLYFHGNNKSARELSEAVLAGVHAIVIDSLYEISLLDSIANKHAKKQGVLVRINPGIEAHTHQYIQTSRVDSKFGFSVSDGAAIEAIKQIQKASNLNFLGIHCHIGSQIFELKPFELAVEKMTDFIQKINTECALDVPELNMGGGYGIHYTAEDKPLEPYQYVDAIVEKLLSCIKIKKITPPRLILEPGRSIVGEAGITLYTVGAIKEIKDVKKYISIDGGMFENPRYALYKAKYEAVLADKAAQTPTEKVTIAGKCCESSDMIIEDAFLPKAESGDILAIFSTGAYNFSMASNYNRNIVPPVLLVNGSKCGYIIKPVDYDDLLRRDANLNEV